MKIKLSVSYSDGGDGSFSLRFFGNRQDALNHLNITEEKLEEGNIYDDGAVEDIEIEIDENGNLLNTPHLSVG